MKKVLFLLLFVLTAGVAHAQFEQGTKFVNTSLTGLNMQFNNDFKLGVEAKGGMFFADDWAFTLGAGIDYGSSKLNSIYGGAGIRYYIEQNGLFLGAGVKYVHQDSNYNDILPGVELGYCFFLNKDISIEPSLYYDISVKDSKNYSACGLKVGFTYYF